MQLNLGVAAGLSSCFILDIVSGHGGFCTKFSLRFFEYSAFADYLSVNGNSALVAHHTM